MNTPGSSSSSKKAKIWRSESVFTLNLDNVDLKDSLRQHWLSGNPCTERIGAVSLSHEPFTHVELSGFISETEYLQGLVRKLDEIKFTEKSSDLFKFKQSDDLASILLSELQSLREFFETTVLDFLIHVTGLPLDGKVDMFLSEYVKTDFLLCHDDELESRRIAFILYLSEDWDASYGGSLDLFASSEEIEPLQIVKSIIPAFNKFVFFNVTSASFHQVAEVVDQNARRLAISGWFYGEPLPRPVLNFPAPESFPVLEIVSAHQNLNEFFMEEYLSPPSYSAINTSLEEFSIAKLKFLIRSEKYDPTLPVLENTDNPSQKITWQERGPANICCYHSPKEQVLPIKLNLPSSLQDLVEVFFTTQFFEFLEKVTEFNILVPTSRTTASLRRFQHKNYVLLKTTDDNVNENTGDGEDEDEGEFWEIAPDEDDDEESEQAGPIESTSTANVAAGSSSAPNGVVAGSSSVPNGVAAGVSSALNGAVAGSSGAPHGAKDSGDEVEDNDKDGSKDQEDGSEGEEDEDDVEREIDVIYYLGEFDWNETFGGQTIYTDRTGQQLLTVTPESNTMAIVVREKGVSSYVSYVNSLAGTQRFHVLSLAIAGCK